MKTTRLLFVLLIAAVVSLLSACGPKPEKADVEIVSCNPEERYCDVMVTNNHRREQDFELGAGLEYPGVELYPLMERYFDANTGQKKVAEFVRTFDPITKVNGTLGSNESRIYRISIPRKIFYHPGQVLLQINLGLGYDGTKFDFVIFSVRESKGPLKLVCNPESFSVLNRGLATKNLMVHLNADLKKPFTWFGLENGDTYQADLPADTRLVSVDLYDVYENELPQRPGHGQTRVYCTPHRDVVYLTPPPGGAKPHQYK